MGVKTMSDRSIAAPRTRPAPPRWTLPERLRVTRRGVQIALGCIWLLDGLLQFQSYMYTHAFLAGVIEPTAKGQPGLISQPILTFAHFYGHDLTLWNTLAAEIQCAIGLGLIVSRRTVRPALAASYLWALVVWWLGEGFGTILSGAPVSPLMGAPGAVFVYAMIGLLVWPKDDNPDGAPVDGGLLGRRGGRVVWSAIWGEAAVLWMLHVDRTREALKEQITGMAEAAPHWLASVQHALANGLGGDGVTVATALAVVSLVIAAGVWTRVGPAALVAGAALSLAYWVYGQSLGGPFWIGQATDVNTGPLLVLLAAALMPVAPLAARQTAEREQVPPRAVAVGA
jgi:hypothetical protein